MRIVYADNALVAVDKPAGLLAVPGRGAGKLDCVARRVQRIFRDALVVHRLDMATSGLMLMARGAPAQRRLAMAFAKRETHKRYLAVVRGCVQSGHGDIDLPLATDWPNRPKQKVDAEHGKPSLTRYRRLAYDAATGTTRLELEPVTGRSHQLRVHLLAIGHPIVGDTLYVPDDPAPRLLLHACALRVPHPVHGGDVQLRSDAPF